MLDKTHSPTTKGETIMLYINKELQNLANINEDACEFYEEACEKAESLQIKSTFRDLEKLHKDVVINLQEHIRANGETPETEETFAGGAREFWGKLMASISNDIDETLVTHLEEAEDRCLNKIQDIIKDEQIPETTKSMLQNEYRALQKSHDYMKALKETMKAA
tara:strand:- start:2820 stop:3311 length:492 start_codon:yes stop_codon:yes gene_type:complete